MWKLEELPALGVVAGRERYGVVDNSPGTDAVHTRVVLLAVICPFICLRAESLPGAEADSTASTQHWQWVGHQSGEGCTHLTLLMLCCILSTGSRLNTQSSNISNPTVEYPTPEVPLNVSYLVLWLQCGLVCGAVCK